VAHLHDLRNKTRPKTRVILDLVSLCRHAFTSGTDKVATGAKMYTIKEVAMWLLLGVGIGFTFGYTIGLKEGTRAGYVRGKIAGQKWANRS